MASEEVPNGAALGLDLVESSADIESEMKIIKEPYVLDHWLGFYQHKLAQYNTLQNPEERLRNQLYQVFILQRACAYLKRSYKLWSVYLGVRVSLVKGLHPLKEKVHFLAVNQAFESALDNLSKFPRVWIRYLSFLTEYQIHSTSLIRKTFNRALRALPITQHHLLWDFALSYIDKLKELLSNSGSSNTSHSHFATIASGYYMKYVKFYPDQAEIVIEKLLDVGDYNSAIRLYEALVINKSSIVSKLGKSSLEVYLDYSDALTQCAKQTMGLGKKLFGSSDPQLQQNLLKFDRKTESVLINLLEAFPDQLGLIVVKLANYHIVRRNFVKADDVFGTYLKKCLTVKDFKLIYDGFLEFKENIIKNLLDKISDFEEGSVNGSEKDSVNKEISRLNILLDINMATFEQLISHRKHYIYDILLRQDLNNCAIWLKKINLYNDDDQLSDKLNCFVEAIKQIKPSKAHYDDFYDDDDEEKTHIEEEAENDDTQAQIEKKESQKATEKLRKTSGLEKIWIDYAKVYETNTDYDTARKIYHSATKVPFINANDLVEIYISWAEMELATDTEQGGNGDDGFERAVKIIENALVEPNFNILGLNSGRVSYFDDTLKAQVKVHKSIKLWSFYLDLVESTGDFERTSDAYERILKMKIVTPIVLLNYVNFLQDNQHYEKSFQVFEVGLEKFNYYPIKNEIYSLYLTRILERFESIKSEENGSKGRVFQYRERIRDLFEQAVSDCPANLVKRLYLWYAAFEEQNRLSGKSLAIYQQCIRHLHLNANEPIPENYLSTLSIQSAAQSDSTSAKVLDHYKDIAEVYKLYIAKTTAFNGVASTRAIYETIINSEPGLPSFVKLGFLLQFKDAEVDLREIDRARAVLRYGAGLVNYNIAHLEYKKDNLRAIEAFWEEWKQFELKYGNEDTYKDMLRAKRAFLGHGV